eukprot:1859583-Pleurochrysis_carterae.AAC.1
MEARVAVVPASHASEEAQSALLSVRMSIFKLSHRFRARASLPPRVVLMLCASFEHHFSSDLQRKVSAYQACSTCFRAEVLPFRFRSPRLRA